MLQADTRRSPVSRRSWRLWAIAPLAAAVLALSACGGGEATFEIGVSIGGQPLNGTVISPGARSSLTMRAGQSIELDASEPVQWTLYVGGSAVSGSGVTVSYAGAEVTITALSASRIAIDTYAPFGLAASVPVTLVATSTFDAAQVATVDILITN